MANVIYNSFKKAIGDGTIDWETTVLKVALVTSVYTPDIDAHTDFTTHVTNEVADGNGYSSGGEILTTPVVTADLVNDWAEYSGDNITWGTSTITARGAVVYASVGGDLVCYVDFGTDKSSSNGDFTINWHADGVLKLA